MDFLEMLKLNEREFSGSEREKLAKNGAALPDGSYPIQTIEDLHNAIQAHGRATNPVEVKAHIKKRAAALGATDCLPDGWKESTRALFANVEQLDEATGNTYKQSTGDLTITVIKPGWSKNNRYYPVELLKQRANIFEGAKMFADHATEQQDKQRPEGSVKDWVGTITAVKAEADGTIKATANIHDEGFKTNLTNLKKAGNLSQMGVSIRAFGECKQGQAEGKKGPIVESLLRCKSVDFVTFPGAGGQVEAMSEAVDPDDVMLLSLDDLKAKRPDLVKALESTNKKSVRNIKKNNGGAANFVEGSPLNGDRGDATITENNTRQAKAVAKGDKALADGLLKLGKITEAEHRKLTGCKPEGYEQLSEAQRKDFDFARLVGISEADAFKLVKITGTTFKEVSRR